MWLVVVATMPGYKSKTTSIKLEDVTTVDFVLDPEVLPEGNLLQRLCDCNCEKKGSLELVEFVGVSHLEVSLILVVVLVFLCFLFRRKVLYNLVRQRHLTWPKRSVMVWCCQHIYLVSMLLYIQVKIKVSFWGI